MAVPLIRVRIANYYSLRRELESFQQIQRGSFKLFLYETLEDLRDYASAITHRSTGTLGDSHSVFFDSGRQRGHVYPNPIYMRPQGKKYRSVDEYAGYEHARGGPHAFYQRTLDEHAQFAVQRGVAAYMGRMPGGVHQ